MRDVPSMNLIRSNLEKAMQHQSQSTGAGTWCRNIKVSLSVFFLLISVLNIKTHPWLWRVLNIAHISLRASTASVPEPRHGFPYTLISLEPPYSRSACIPRFQIPWIVLRHIPTTYSGKFRKRKRSSICMDTEAKRVWTAEEGPAVAAM